MVYKYCICESEDNFADWFEKRKLHNVHLIDYRCLDSDSTKSLQKRASIWEPPPDYGMTITSDERILCFVDVKCPDTGVGIHYNLPDYLFRKYRRYSEFFSCPCYLVFYEQVRSAIDDATVEAHSTAEIEGWAELGYLEPTFNNRKIKVTRSPFEYELLKLTQT